MKILLIGATGFVGSQILIALTAAGHNTKQLSRQQGYNITEMRSAADWLPLLEGVDAVINAVGIIAESGSQRFDNLHATAPIALFQACAQVGVRRVVQISALGADSTAFSAYHLSKRAADDYLRTLDLDWFVLRPSLIYSKSGKSAQAFMRLARLPIIPIVGDGQQQIQPVHVSDLVATVMKCLTTEQTQQTLDIVGAKAIDLSDWLALMRRAQGLPPAGFLHIPSSLAMACCYLGRYVNGLLEPDNLRMLAQGNTGDTQGIAAFLGRPPLAPEAPLFFTDKAPQGGQYDLHTA